MNRFNSFPNRLKSLSQGDAILKKLASKGAPALVIKIATAGLTFVMFVLLARWLTPEEYGRYATLFTLGTFLGYVIVGGLHTLALRRLPELDHHQRPDTAARLVRDGYLTIIMLAASLAALAWIGAAALGGVAGPPAWSPLIAILLAAPFALAEYQSNILRGWGSVHTALLPRDVAWRILTILAVGGLTLTGLRLGALEAFAITAATLFVLVLAQFALGLSRAPAGAFEAARTGAVQPISLLIEARWLWAAAVASALIAQLGVVSVGMVLGDVDAGRFFAAQRTSALLSLPLIAAEIVGGPLIARAWAARNTREIQNICNYIVIGITIPTLAGLLFFILFGGHLMSLFGHEYASTKGILLIMSVGTLINALCGPTAVIMLMTGNERSFVGYYASAQLVGLALVTGLAATAGVNGAAVASAASVIIWNLAVRQWSVRRLGIDPTAASFLGEKSF